MARTRRARTTRTARTEAHDAGFITVRVGQLPGRIQEIALNGERTVSAAVGAAGFAADGFQIKVNSEDAALDTAVKEGDVILLVRKITGN